MILRVNRVPGRVTRSTRKGSTTIVAGSIGDATADLSNVPGYIPSSVVVSVVGLFDNDQGIATSITVLGGNITFPGTQFDAADDTNVTAPLSRFIGAT